MTQLRFLTYVISVAVWLAVPSSFAAQSTGCCTPISLEVKSSRRSDRTPILHVKLQNNGTSPVRVGPAQSPWVGPAMLKVVGMRLPEGVPIQNMTQAVVDPSPLPELVQSKRSVEDVIDLGEMYPELAAEIRKGRHDIIVFWTYKFATAETQSERLGGWVLFEAMKP